jgi:hypothetical protein
VPASGGHIFFGAHCYAWGLRTRLPEQFGYSPPFRMSRGRGLIRLYLSCYVINQESADFPVKRKIVNFTKRKNDAEFRGALPGRFVLLLLLPQVSSARSPALSAKLKGHAL